MLWLGFWSSSFVAGPMQHRMAAAPHERRFVQLSAHRCPGALHKWRLPHGSRDRCTLQEEVSWSWGASGSEWVWIVITDKCNTYHMHLVLSFLLFCVEKQPGQCAVLKRSGRFVYYLVRWIVAFISLRSMFYKIRWVFWTFDFLFFVIQNLHFLFFLH